MAPKLAYGTLDDLVLVTGASGFIAKHVVKEALGRGHRVRGTIRRPEAELEIRAAVGEFTSRLSFVRADLLSDEGWPRAVMGCRYVLHVASVCPLAAPPDPEALVPVARDGTLRVLRAASFAGVERVVVTSSSYAVCSGYQPDPERIFTEADWSLADSPLTDSYARSKTLAERAAWELAKEVPNMSLVSINPSVAMGPPLDRHVDTSARVIQTLLRGRYPLVPEYGMEIVDVRDIAAAHLAALETPAAAGRRFIVSNQPLMLRELGAILAREFPEFARRMPKGTLPRVATRLLGHLDPAVRRIVPDLGPPKRTSTQALRDVLGIHPRPAEQAIIEMARAVIAFRMV